jgi:hypothetical protein
MNRGVRRFWWLLVAIASFILWIVCAWAFPGRIVLGDVLGATFLILALMRVMHPVPEDNDERG